MPRGERTEVQMRAFAEEHLNYEYQMLMATAIELSNSSHPQHVRNSLLESFTIHLRALVDFIWEPQRLRDDDAVASDFFNSPEKWLNVRPSFPDALEPARSRTGKEVAHLTYARLDVTADAKRWHIVDMANAIAAALAVFAKNADHAYLGDALSELKTTQAASLHMNSI